MAVRTDPTPPTDNALIDWRIGSNHNEIVVTGEDHPAPPADAFLDWLLSPNHSEIIVVDRA